ncbi:class I SAM-dependent methyltransferase [Candidatus Parcubacteria bacterium]|nr:class I SAM-dependent methyltransferase [Candidatus Parcubacteria bacterium]
MIIVQIIGLIIQISAVVFMIIFLYSSFRSSRSGAPFVPIPFRAVKSLLSLADIGPNDIMYDFGCGDGRVLKSAVKFFGVTKAVGFEIAPWPYAMALWNIRKHPNIEIRKEDFFNAPIKDATFIYSYLLPNLVDRLAPKWATELKSGTRILCPDFPINLVSHPEFSLLKQQKIGRITAYLYQRV